MSDEKKPDSSREVTVVQRKQVKPGGWGKESYPFPAGAGYIECDEMKCVGCGMCQMACSMKHNGVINKELSRIDVRKYLLPLPKAVQVTCTQCGDGERECEAACPTSPASIYFDKQTLHMVINEDTCLGNDCLQCREACPAKAVRSYPSATEAPFVCDLCDTENNGDLDPQCVNVCPYTAVRFMESAEPRYGFTYHDLTRKHPDEKADLIAKRLYPLRRDSIANPGWR